MKELYPSIWNKIKALALSENFPHAFLFIGPKFSGKEELALEVAQALNCKKNNFNPCQKCAWCLEIKSKREESFIFIDLKEQKKEISIGQIRDLIWRFSLSSYLGAKVAIINQADKMNFEAQNALLKTLEEPKGKKAIILLSEREGRILETLKSRSFVFYLNLPSIERLVSFLVKKFKIEESKAKEISKLSLKLPQLAKELALDKEKLTKIKRTFMEIGTLEKGKIIEKLKLAEELSKKDLQEINYLFNLWLAFLEAKLKKSAKENNQKEAREVAFKINKIQKINWIVNYTQTNKLLAFENLALSL